LKLDASALLHLFGAERGLVCAIGAGGKKSTLYRLAAAHPGPLALTTTVGSAEFPADLDLRAVVAPEDEILPLVQALADCERLAFACPHSRGDRLAGLPPTMIAALHEDTARLVTLVKADGARMRWLKAAKRGEPVLPPGTETVLVVTSARAFGEPLTERVAHRLDRVLAVTGAAEGDLVTPELVASLYTRPGGLLDGLDVPRVIPVINMVDDETRLEPARAAARAILESTTGIPRVILAAMKRADEPVVEVIEG
jgi:probable selenium-dependent hydroxylase accessory protein YqeC